ncbi:hypothetical protein ACL58G_22465 [Massilia sp. GER05]|uniref:hypothetical protein n=1 Tax=Massilia sp. GER05 TaxID=3394605 RepID=UPI003F843A58
MARRPGLLAGALAVGLSCAASAYADPAYEGWLLRMGDYETLANVWRADRDSDDGAQQERLAALFLGPHARAAKARPFEGIHNLYWAALRGRRGAVLRLADALDKGAFGLRKRPDAARCWAQLPATFDARLACVRLTEFRDPKARLGCGDLPIARANGRPLDGADAARICVATGTPTLLEPGPPPGPETVGRIRAYARHGITLSVTGDVYDPAFEAYRDRFNRTTVAALEARHGRGYLERLEHEVDARASSQ